MKKMNKKIAVALTAALLALPLNSALALADSVSSSSTAITSTSATADSAVLQAETAVSAYESVPITTLTEITAAEGLKAAADTAVAAVTDESAKEAFKLRVTHRAAAIAIAKTVLQAEAAVSAYESAPITTLSEITTAEGLKAAADTATAAVADVTAKKAFEQRITNRAAAIAKAKTLLTPVVDDSGNTVSPENWLTELIGKLQLALTYDPAQKAKLNEKHALAKLAEAQKLMKAEKSEAAQNCLKEYSDKITQAQEFLEQVKDPNSEAAKNLAAALVNVNSNNVQVLGNLLDKLPPQAAQKLALNVVRSMDKAVQKIEKENTPAETKTTPVTTATTSAKNDAALKKQAQVALENFKKSLKQKDKHYLDDQRQEKKIEQPIAAQFKADQSQQVQSLPLSQPTHVTVASIRPQSELTVMHPSKPSSEVRSKGVESEKKKAADKEDNHRNKK